MKKEITTHFTKAHLLGEIAWLMAHSDLHRNWEVGALQQWVSPALQLKQFRLYHQKDGQPVGYIAWAFLTDDKAEKYKDGSTEVFPEDWNAGENLWVMELIAPFGHGTKIINDMKHNIFPDKVGHALRVMPDGKTRVMTSKGVNLANE